MSVEAIALGLVAAASAGMAVFVWAAFVVARESDDLSDRFVDRELGDWPRIEDVFPPHVDERNS
jgi:beta-phosphoglucomutase-like phosphatase (HAD superfamily)